MTDKNDLKYWTRSFSASGKHRVGCSASREKQFSLSLSSFTEEGKLHVWFVPSATCCARDMYEGAVHSGTPTTPVLFLPLYKSIGGPNCIGKKVNQIALPFKPLLTIISYWQSCSKLHLMTQSCTSRYTHLQNLPKDSKSVM